MFNRFEMELNEPVHRSCDPLRNKHKDPSSPILRSNRLSGLRGSTTKPFFYEPLRLGR